MWWRGDHAKAKLFGNSSRFYHLFHGETLKQLHLCRHLCNVYAGYNGEFTLYPKLVTRVLQWQEQSLPHLFELQDSKIYMDRHQCSTIWEEELLAKFIQMTFNGERRGEERTHRGKQHFPSSRITLCALINHCKQSILSLLNTNNTILCS